MTSAEFFVQDIVKGRAGKILFVGFLNEGDSVRVGDQFVVKYEVPRTLEDILNESPAAAPTNIYKVSLTVTAIESMRKLVEELPRGVTGALTLSGEGMNHVGKNTFIRKSPLV